MTDIDCMNFHKPDFDCIDFHMTDFDYIDYGLSHSGFSLNRLSSYAISLHGLSLNRLSVSRYGVSFYGLSLSAIWHVSTIDQEMQYWKGKRVFFLGTYFWLEKTTFGSISSGNAMPTCWGTWMKLTRNLSKQFNYYYYILKAYTIALSTAQGHLRAFHSIKSYISWIQYKTCTFLQT